MSLGENIQRNSISTLSKLSLPLAIGDVIAFLVFAAIGRASHAEAAGLDAIVQIAETASPFLIGWMIVAPLLGAYRSDIITAPRTMATRTSLAWLLAWPIGLGLRALIRQSGIPLVFALITGVTVLLILLIWRSIFAFVVGRNHS